MKSILLVLDSQRREFSSIFRPVYDFLVNLKQGIFFKFKVLPTLKKLSKDENVNLSIITLDLRVEQILKNSGLPFISRNEITGNLYDMEIGKKSFSFVRDLIQKLKTADTSTVYRGLSLWDMDELGIWRYNFYPIIKFIDFLEKDFEAIKPDEVIVFDRETLFQNLLLLMAKKRNLSVEDKTSAFSSIAKVSRRLGIQALGWTNIYKDIRKLGKGKAKPEPNGKKKILISHDMKAANKLVHWIKKANNEKCNAFYVGVRDIQAEFEKNSLKYKNLPDYSTKASAKAIKDYSKKIKKTFKQLDQDKNFQELFIYKGIPLWGPSKDFFTFLYSARYHELVAYIELINNMLEMENPNVVATIDDRSRYGKILIGVSHQKEIPTLIVQHGLAIEHPMYGPTLVDKMAIYGEQSRQMLTNAGVDPEKLVITGQPEPVPKEDIETIRGRIYSQFGIPLDKKMVVFTSQTLSESVNYLLFDSIYKTMAKFKDVQFISKLHPDERLNLHEEMIQKYGIKNVKIIKRINLEELLLASDLLLNFYSTVGMEAIRMGVPLVSINVNKLPDSFFAKENNKNIFMARTDAELADCIRKALALDKRKEVEEIKKAGMYYIIERDDKACENVAKLIDSMATKHTPKGEPDLNYKSQVK